MVVAQPNQPHAKRCQVRSVQPALVKLPAGSLCEAVFGDAWYPASILEVGASGYKVSFLGYNNEETLASASVRALSHEPSLDGASVTDGLACEALYVVDGQWHDVLVQSDGNLHVMHARCW